MNHHANPTIASTVQAIKEVDDMIKSLERQLPNTAIEFSILQFIDLKKDLVKQVLAELVSSNLSFYELEPFLQHAVAYLKKHDQKVKPSSELKANLAEMERMMALN